MTFATLRLDLRVRQAQGVRDQRRQMQAIMDKLHRAFNVSVAEVDGDEPGSVVLVVAAVSRARRDARETLERVADAVAAHPRAEVFRQEITEH